MQGGTQVPLQLHGLLKAHGAAPQSPRRIESTRDEARRFAQAGQVTQQLDGKFETCCLTACLQMCFVGSQWHAGAQLSPASMCYSTA